MILMGLALASDVLERDSWDDFAPAAHDMDGAPTTRVVNGDVEDGFPSVVSLGLPPISVCTGNLITPRLVLSAAHCSGGIPLEEVVQFGRVSFGATASSPEQSVSMEQAVIHPQYRPLEGYDVGAFDLAVVELVEPVDIDPIPFRRLPLNEGVIGDEVVSVGFGIDEEGVGGIKRSSPLVVSDFDEMFLMSDNDGNPDRANICSGDSGGPQLMQTDAGWVQVGVHSWATVGCDGTSGSTRTDVAANWILDQVERVHGTRDLCEAAGRYDNGICDSCERVDPDCLPPENARAVRELRASTCSMGIPAGWFRAWARR